MNLYTTLSILHQHEKHTFDDVTKFGEENRPCDITQLYKLSAQSTALTYMKLQHKNGRWLKSWQKIHFLYKEAYNGKQYYSYQAFPYIIILQTLPLTHKVQCLCTMSWTTP